MQTLIRFIVASGIVVLTACNPVSETESEDAPPFIDPLTLSQNVCRGGSQAQPLTLADAAASPSAHFQLGAPFALPSEVTDHFHYPISTSDAQAQLWFDTGLAHMANFNHDEAIAAFREAQRLDPDCAMCFWGEGLSFGSNINVPYAPERGAAGRLAANHAVARIASASQHEAQLI